MPIVIGGGGKYIDACLEVQRKRPDGDTIGYRRVRIDIYELRQPLLECERPETSVISGMQSTHANSADEISGMQSTHAFNQCNQFEIDSSQRTRRISVVR